MNEVIEVVEAAGFAEEQVLDALGEFDILRALEPYQLALVGTIEEGRREALRLTDTDRMPFGHFTDNLDVSVLVVEFCDTVELTAVDIFVGVRPQQIHRGLHPEFFTKNVGTFGTDILTIRYISLR